MVNKVFVVAAHPDDEILGCGGTMRRHFEKGDQVHCLILAEGITSRIVGSEMHNSKKLNMLTTAAKQANKIIGVQSLYMHDFTDNSMDQLPLLSVVKIVEKHLFEIKPNVVYTHCPNDLNIDHRITAAAVITACRPVPGSSVERLLFFEVPSSTDWQVIGSNVCFSPNWFIDISATLSRKLEALQAYQTEMRPWPHARSIKAVEHLACWRGAIAGCDAAEAFMLGRLINKAEG